MLLQLFRCVVVVPNMCRPRFLIRWQSRRNAFVLANQRIASLFEDVEEEDGEVEKEEEADGQEEEEENDVAGVASILVELSQVWCIEEILYGNFPSKNFCHCHWICRERGSRWLSGRNIFSRNVLHELQICLGCSLWLIGDRWVWEWNNCWFKHPIFIVLLIHSNTRWCLA